jgi:hypothetical protein
MFGLIQLIVLCTASYTPVQAGDRRDLGTVKLVDHEHRNGIVLSKGGVGMCYFSFDDFEDQREIQNLRIGTRIQFDVVKEPSPSSIKLPNQGWHAVRIISAN